MPRTIDVEAYAIERSHRRRAWAEDERRANRELYAMAAVLVAALVLIPAIMEVLS